MKTVHLALTPWFFPSLGQVKEHLTKQGMKPLKLSEVPKGTADGRMVCLGGDTPVFASDGVALEWNWAVADYWVYPIVG